MALASHGWLAVGYNDVATAVASDQAVSLRLVPMGHGAVSRKDFSIGKGRFLNQKLGKNVSRKFGLLKSELAGGANRKPVARRVNLSGPKKEISRGKP